MTQIPHTNLVLIVADKMCPCYSARISVNPVKVDYGPKNETKYCEKLKTNLYRQKPKPSISYHKHVSCSVAAVKYFLTLKYFSGGGDQSVWWQL